MGSICSSICPPPSTHTPHLVFDTALLSTARHHFAPLKSTHELCISFLYSKGNEHGASGSLSATRAICCACTLRVRVPAKAENQRVVVRRPRRVTAIEDIVITHESRIMNHEKAKVQRRKCTASARPRSKSREMLLLEAANIRGDDKPA